MPVMGMNRADLHIKPFLFSKTRGSLIALLYGHTGNEYYVNQIMQILDSGSGSVQRELRLMTEAGLLDRTKRGNLVYYQANGKCPIFNELKSLADKGIFSSMAISSNLSGSDKRLIKCNPGIGIPRRKIAGFCRRHHIRKLSLFGSVLRDDFGPDSDVDVLVEFLPGHTPGYFSLFDMETEFSALLGGRKADIRTSQDLSRYFRDQVIREARVQYEAAG
jgi:predicted nucleotidyltransferase